MENTQATQPIEYAGFWRRLAAHFFDGIIIGIPVGLLLDLLEKIMPATIVAILQPVLIVGITAIFIASRWQASVGKRIMNIFVVHNYGRIFIGRAIAREFLYTLVMIVLTALIFFIVMKINDLTFSNVTSMTKEQQSMVMSFIGLGILVLTIIWYVPLIFTKQKTALHDIILNTRVIKGKSEDYYDMNKEGK